MNFLAHAFLTPNNGQLLIGNFFGDSFKGKPEKHGPRMVSEGIKLHRSIDHYTDTHPLVLKAVDLFRPQQKRFAPVVIDMVFDHLLASEFHHWSDIGLSPFSTSVFNLIDEQEQHIPTKAMLFYPHLKKHNWLLHYSKMKGLQLALEGMDRRISSPTTLANSVSLVHEHRDELMDLFNPFFKDLQNHVYDYLANMDFDIDSNFAPLK
ncbi:MAG: acyl carrier protein phosphodiesterase [Granulosicoccus sp.]